MRIFLTDATGFIGPAVITVLIKAGYRANRLRRFGAGVQAVVAGVQV